MKQKILITILLVLTASAYGGIFYYADQICNH